MQVGPFVLYALAEIRQQEIERKARTAWQRQAPAVPRPGPVVRDAAVRLDAVAHGC